MGAGAGENRETGEGIQSLCLPFCRRSSLLFLAHAHFSHILTESEFSLIFSLSFFFSLFFFPPLFSPSFFPSFYFVLRIKIFSCSSLSLCLRCFACQEILFPQTRLYQIWIHLQAPPESSSRFACYLNV